MRIKRVLQLPFHPLLFGCFPLVSFLAQNIEHVAFEDAARSAWIIAASVLVLVAALWILFRNLQRAALLVTILTLLFFSYGHVYAFVEGISLLGVTIGRHRYLASVYLAAFAIACYWALRDRRALSCTAALNTIGATLFILPLIRIAQYESQYFSTRPGSEEAGAPFAPGLSETAAPDIYYVILDAYTRHDTMLDFYGYDNQPFLEELEARGFYVASRSMSNYARTSLSLASSLNLNYLQELTPHLTDGSVLRLFHDNAVGRILDGLGYTTVAFETTYEPVRWDEAEVYYTFEIQEADMPTLTAGMSEFEAVFARTTPLTILLEMDSAFQARFRALAEESPRLQRYMLIRRNLAALVEAASIPSPKFVFAHINAPHEPYIFDRTGAFVPEQDDPLEGYRQQVMFINDSILDVIDSILQSSEETPIIILQGDHGGSETWGDFRRMHILNAYLLPGDGAQQLYPEITPVNTFRLVLDHYFGSHYGLLPDVSYHSYWSADFDFTVVPDTPSEDGQ